MAYSKLLGTSWWVGWKAGDLINESRYSWDVEICRKGGIQTSWGNTSLAAINVANQRMAGWLFRMIPRVTSCTGGVIGAGAGYNPDYGSLAVSTDGRAGYVKYIAYDLTTIEFYYDLINESPTCDVPCWRVTITGLDFAITSYLLPESFWPDQKGYTCQIVDGLVTLDLQINPPDMPLSMLNMAYYELHPCNTPIVVSDANCSSCGSSDDSVVDIGTDGSGGDSSCPTIQTTPNRGTVDPTGSGLSACSRRFMVTIAARNLEDLAEKLNTRFLNVPLKWPIESIHKFTRPVYTDDIDDQTAAGIDHSYNEMVPVDFSGVTGLFNFGTDYFMLTSVRAVAVLLTEIFESGIIVGSGSIRLGGHVVFPSNMYYASVPSAGVVFGDDYLTSVIGAEATLIYKDIFNSSTGQELTTSTDVITTICDCVPLTKSIVMKHNLSSNNALYYFLKKNNTSLLDYLVLVYNEYDEVWRYTTYYKDDLERWSIIFEWNCDTSNGPTVWKFSLQIRQTIISSGKVFSTRLLFSFLARDTCESSMIDFGFNVNVKTHAVTSNELTSWGDFDIFIDEIGLFKTNYWMNNPSLTIIMPVTGANTEYATFDISPSFPVSPTVLGTGPTVMTIF